MRVSYSASNDSLLATSPSKPSGHYMYHQLTFTNSTFCPHSVFMYFVWIWEQTAIISLYSINWLVCVTETDSLLRGTDWIFIYNSTFCPHSVFMCFVWIWEQTAIISLKRKSKFVPVHALEAHTGSEGFTSTQNIVKISKQRLLPHSVFVSYNRQWIFPYTTFRSWSV